MLGNHSSTPSAPHHSQMSNLNSELLGSADTWLHHSCLNLVLGYRKEIWPIRGLISRLLFQGHRWCWCQQTWCTLQQNFLSNRWEEWGRQRRCLVEGSTSPYQKHPTCSSQTVRFCKHKDVCVKLQAISSTTLFLRTLLWDTGSKNWDHWLAAVLYSLPMASVPNHRDTGN